ncbi:hypothetical protein GCM10027028_50780 [Streptomyces sundarbansensis]
MAVFVVAFMADTVSDFDGIRLTLALRRDDVQRDDVSRAEGQTVRTEGQKDRQKHSGTAGQQGGRAAGRRTGQQDDVQDAERDDGGDHGVSWRRLRCGFPPRSSSPTRR